MLGLWIQTCLNVHTGHTVWCWASQFSSWRPAFLIWKMEIIIVVRSDWDNPWKAFGIRPGTGYVPSKCQLLIHFIDSKMLFFFFFFFILTSLKSVCFLKLMACHGLNGGIFSSLVVSKTMVYLTIDGVLDLVKYGVWCEGSWGAVLWIIRHPRGVLEFWESQVCLSCVHLPSAPCTHRSKSNESWINKVDLLGKTLSGRVSMIPGVLARSSFFGPCSCFLLGDFKPGQLGLGEACGA